MEILQDQPLKIIHELLPETFMVRSKGRRQKPLEIEGNKPFIMIVPA